MLQVSSPLPHTSSLSSYLVSPHFFIHPSKLQGGAHSSVFSIPSSPLPIVILPTDHHTSNGSCGWRHMGNHLWWVWWWSTISVPWCLDKRGLGGVSDVVCIMELGGACHVGIPLLGLLVSLITLLYLNDTPHILFWWGGGDWHGHWWVWVITSVGCYQYIRT